MEPDLKAACLLAALLLLTAAAPQGSGLAPGAMSGAGTGLAPGAGGLAPPPPAPPAMAPPPVSLSAPLALTPGLAPVGGGPPLVPVLPRRRPQQRPR